MLIIMTLKRLIHFSNINSDVSGSTYALGLQVEALVLRRLCRSLVAMHNASYKLKSWYLWIEFWSYKLTKTQGRWVAMKKEKRNC